MYGIFSKCFRKKPSINEPNPINELLDFLQKFQDDNSMLQGNKGKPSLPHMDTDAAEQEDINWVVNNLDDHNTRAKAIFVSKVNRLIDSTDPKMMTNENKNKCLAILSGYTFLKECENKFDNKFHTTTITNTVSK